MTGRVLGIALGAAFLASLMSSPAEARGAACRTYVKVPISMAISSAKAFAVLKNRVALQRNPLRGELGPHHYAYYPVFNPRCRYKVAHRGGRRSLKR
ncbi:MAG: hypothetical protein MPJ78_11700 [Hyphomicrobiaceae bacterium]|nr:hypothetical protein [Hyphomicrobiaceae bacterium]